MKFKFCGGLDCPDWVLAEINNLSKISSVKLKLICTQAVKLFTHANSFEPEKVQKHLSDAKLDSEQDVQGILAAILFLLKGAVSHQVANDAFVSEMQQIGLPKEHSGVLGRTLQTNLELIMNTLREQSFRIGRVGECRARPNFYLVDSDKQFEWGSKLIKCDETEVTILDKSDSSRNAAFAVKNHQLQSLIHELKVARNLMQRFSPT